MQFLNVYIAGCTSKTTIGFSFGFSYAVVPWVQVYIHYLTKWTTPSISVDGSGCLEPACDSLN
jgi:hypothetical protein